MRILLFSLFFFLLYSAPALAQDSLVLINGRVIVVKSVDLKDYTIAYRKMDGKSRLKTIDPERVFSIRYRDGSEKVIYTSDSMDTEDFKPEEMRMFILGEQDAHKFYRNNLNKGFGFAFGAGGSLLGFYGLAVAPLYGSIVGAFSPNMEKQKVSDKNLILNPNYREGYERKARDRKIRNGVISGLIGFVAGSVIFNLIY